MQNKKLNIIRKKLDRLDGELLALFKKRTILVNEVLKTKKFKNQIVDRRRINLILKKIKTKSIKKGIDPKITNSIWKSIISAYVNYEFRNFKKK
jgi:chorismate mutase